MHIFFIYTLHQAELLKLGKKVLGKHFFPLIERCLLALPFCFDFEIHCNPHSTTVLKMIFLVGFFLSYACCQLPLHSCCGATDGDVGGADVVPQIQRQKSNSQGST